MILVEQFALLILLLNGRIMVHINYFNKSGGGQYGKRSGAGADLFDQPDGAGP